MKMNVRYMKFDGAFSCVFVLLALISIQSLDGKWVDESVWSYKLGEELWNFSKLVTKYADIKSKYTGLNTTVKDGRTLLRDIRNNVGKMLQKKIQAVKYLHICQGPEGGGVGGNMFELLNTRLQLYNCIAKAAEELRKNVYYMDDFRLEYYNMKYSFAEGSDHSPTVPWELEGATEYKNMSLEPNPSFYNIPINMNYSAVHIPTNVYDRYRHVAETITWSEELDEIFLRNYHSDPALSWQYFGSTFGMMRQYPAMQWNAAEDDVDLYDCRTRPWFIEAATCTKDVIILMDNSGSMTGMRNTIAKLVVNSLLKTFGNNDFINVLRFSWRAESVLPCFKDELAQATPETIKSFQEAVSKVKPEGNASFPHALGYSLQLLEEYRNKRKCGEDGGCNQAIMLVTDGLPGNVTEVFENLNLGPDGIPPVRVFTFLVGTEVKGVRDLQLMACRNRGYYVHIHDLDEVHDQVLKYIPVVARPLVLQGNEHPVVWTHAFADINDPKLAAWLWKVMKSGEQEFRLLQHQSIKPEYFSEQREDSKYVQKIRQNQGEEKQIEHQEYRLMTSVSIPAFDKKENNEVCTNNGENNEVCVRCKDGSMNHLWKILTLKAIPKSKTAELLGVAGTDIPIDHLYALTFPYKTGANGYAFIVTNNGYLLMHPDLRPVYQGTLKLNFDSIDLAEVEFLDDNYLYKEYSPVILEMRESMVNQMDMELLEKRAKFHYDDMRRVGVERRNFYVTSLPGTPFSIGLALPSDFADYHITSGLKIEWNDVNFTKEGIAFDSYLKKKNENERDMEWKIHPDWTYCKYHYPNFKKFDSPEDELLHFLEKMKEPDWKWSEQYPDSNSVDDNCDSQVMHEDGYFCDKDLLELLIVDAQILDSFRIPRIPKNSFETKLLDTYNPNLRFVSTQSGLTKWQLIPKPSPGEEVDSDFIEAFPRAIDETWYKMAVLQNYVDEESFVFSVPFKSRDAEETFVIATHAVFHKKTHDGKKAPAAVLGYRFEQSSFYHRFMDITSETDRFTLPCYSDARECFLVDHNGYIIVSSRSVNETGGFFGEYEPSVMSQMVQLGIFQEKLIYDYQALCVEEVAISNEANFLMTPFMVLGKMIHFVFIDLWWSVLRLFSVQAYYTWDMGLSLPNDDSREFKEYDSDEDMSEEELFEAEKEEFLNATVRIERNTWPCDKNKTLYLLQQNIFSEKHIYGVRANSSRFRFADRIPHTNLILVVINTLYSDYGDVQLSIEPNTLPPEECRGSNIFHLPRKRRSNCFTQHIEEIEVEACGKAHQRFSSNFFLVFLFTLELVLVLVN